MSVADPRLEFLDEAPPAPTLEVLTIVEIALRISETSHGRAGIGSVPCPACAAGAIRYRIWRRAGLSVVATCTTPGCVAVVA